MDSMVQALCIEIALRSIEVQEPIETIYFGGGTPSTLSKSQLAMIINRLKSCFKVEKEIEFTIEVNPDDLNQTYLEGLKALGVNRLSIGVQSFFDKHLLWMNRSHNATDAKNCIKTAIDLGFEVSSIDLIYGFETLSQADWEYNIKTACNSGLQHLSCYALTIEEKTPFARIAAKENTRFTNDELAKKHFDYLHNTLIKEGWQHYEISNFAKNQQYSKHNQSYWKGLPYIGIGPGAHSYNGKNKRQWNVADNLRYIDALAQKETFYTSELLTERDLRNEKIMVGLRTSEGIDTALLAVQLANKQHKIHQFIENGMATRSQNNFCLSTEGWWYSDSIIAELFEV